jgi:hypothetical protein
MRSLCVMGCRSLLLVSRFGSSRFWRNVVIIAVYLRAGSCRVQSPRLEILSLLGLHQIFQSIRHLGRNNHVALFNVCQKVGSFDHISKAVVLFNIKVRNVDDEKHE